MFDLEIYILTIMAIFFCSIYLLKRQTVKPWTWAGIIGSFCWIIMSIVYFVGRAGDPELSPTRIYVIALFFSGIGIIFIVLMVIDMISMRSLGRKLAGDED